jgi:hypothetical protein
MKKPEVLASIEKHLSEVQPYKKKTWLDSCQPEVRRDFEEIKKRFKAGKYEHASRAAVAKAIGSEMATHTGITLSTSAIERWLSK